MKTGGSCLVVDNLYSDDVSEIQTSFKEHLTLELCWYILNQRRIANHIPKDKLKHVVSSIWMSKLRHTKSDWGKSRKEKKI